MDVHFCRRRGSQILVAGGGADSGNRDPLELGFIRVLTEIEKCGKFGMMVDGKGRHLVRSSEKDSHEC